MKHVILYLVIGFGYWSAQPAQSQDINVVARAKPAGPILLRWIPGNETVWQQGNQSGYLIERTTLSRNGVPLALPETVTLTSQPLKPATSAQWQPYLLPDSIYHQALHEVLYSPDPTIPTDTTNQLAITQDSTTAAEQRYIFAMIAADQSFSAARLAALGFTDLTGLANEQYRYRIRVAGQAGITLGEVLIGPSDALPLLPIPKPIVRFETQQAVLQWPADTTVRGFNSYWVERSVDGQTFVSRNKLPLMSAGAVQDTVSFQDSLPKKRQVYYYRLRGKTIFDEWGYSPVVFGQSKSPVAYSPRITQARIPSPGTLEVHWRFPADTLLPRLDTLIANYWIGASSTADGTLVRLKVNLAPADTSTLISQYGQKIAVNGPQYITVVAMSLDGDTLRSYPVLVQPSDSLPPAIPTGLQGTIDPAGRVQIQWKTNTEPDLLGYKVFRAERVGDEPSALLGEPIAVASWVDTVSLNHLNRDLLYYVQAIDQQFNQSALSLPLKLTRPDTLRPASPWIQDYERTNAGVIVRWANSASPDVIRHTLYRKALSGADTTWQMIQVFTAGDTTYRDEPLIAPADYAYNILAEDAGGLQSILLAPLLVNLSARVASHPPITVLNATVDGGQNAVRLDWSYSAPGLVKYELYRAEGTSPLAPWQFVSAPKKTTQDPRVKADSTYRYAIRALFRDGSVTNWQSQTITYRRTDTTFNDPPRLALALPDLLVNQGESVSWNVPTGTFTDLDGTIVQVHISSVGLPAGFTVSGATLSGQTTQTGVFTGTVFAEDDGGKATSGTFHLRVNARPILQIDSLRYVATVGRPFTYTLPTNLYVDRDGQVTDFEWESGDVPVGVQLNGLELAGTLSTRGLFRIRLRVRDNDGAVAIDTLYLRANQAPVIVTQPGSQTATWKEPYAYTIPATVFGDEDGQIVSLVVLTDSLPPGLAASGSRLAGVPTQPGQYPIRLRAVDDRGADAEFRWTLTVTGGGNQLPVVASGLQTLVLPTGEFVNYTIPPGTFFDPDGQIVSITLTGTLPTGLSATGGQLRGIPTSAGSTTLTVTATDDRGGTVTTSWLITVLNLTTTPVIDGSRTICSGQSTLLTVSGCSGMITWSTGANGASVTVSPLSTTTYSVTCVDNGITSPAASPVVVTVKSSPTVTLASNSPITAGQTLTLSTTATSGATLQWQGPNGFTSTATNATIANSTSLASGVYSVTATQNGCSAVASLSVTVGPLSSYTLCIEAEDPLLTTGTGTVSSDPLASGGARIGNYSNSSTNRRFTLNNIPATTTYQIRVRYLVSTSSAQAAVLINEGVATISLNTGGYQVYLLSNKTLNQGNGNTLRIQGNGTGTFLLDQVCIVK